VEAVGRLLGDARALATMGERARTLAVPDAADRIVRLLFEVVGAEPPVR
jgi:UDP-N-acetylglucosamine:LPS N-acetylglucosamine transferase